MPKELSEMSLEELWELFPISLVEHNDKWELYYDEIETILKNLLAECPIERMSTEANRISLNRGYTESGFAEKVFHVHIRYVGDNDELYFRDYLNEHPQIAKEYEMLKLQLWKQFEYNRDAYTSAKTEFVRKQTLEAKKVYAGRY